MHTFAEAALHNMPAGLIGTVKQIKMQSYEGMRGVCGAPEDTPAALGSSSERVPLGRCERRRSKLPHPIFVGPAKT